MLMQTGTTLMLTDDPQCLYVHNKTIAICNVRMLAEKGNHNSLWNSRSALKKSNYTHEETFQKCAAT